MPYFVSVYSYINCCSMSLKQVSFFVTYIIAAINGSFLTSLGFFFFLLEIKKTKMQRATGNLQAYKCEFLHPEVLPKILNKCFLKESFKNAHVFVFVSL